MHNLFNKKLAALAVSMAVLAGCGDVPSSSSSTSTDIPTGVADYDSFTLAIEKDAVEGIAIAGVENTITAYVADRSNYRVDDGTVVNFITDSGALDKGSCSTVGGTCSVTWSSQNPNPTNGYAQIVAYTSGEESFVDVNDNGSFDDVIETAFDVPEPYLDSNRSGAYDAATEEYVDSDNNGSYTNGDGLYTGTLCVGDTTVCNRANTNIWRGAEFAVTGNAATLTNIGITTAAADSTSTLQFQLLDTTSGAPVATGTSIALSATEGTFTPSAPTILNGSNGTFTSSFKAGATVQTITITFEITFPESNVTVVKTLTFGVT